MTPTNECKQLQTQIQEERAATGTSMLEYSIADNVVLAGQPEPEDWRPLAERGFSLVVNIRSDPGRAATQAENAAEHGLRSVHLPLPAYQLEPEHVQSFRDVVDSANGDKVLVHCRTASRTALLWMLTRMTLDGWSHEQAEEELRAAGYTEEDMEVFNFCAEDFFERTVDTAIFV